MYIFTPVYCVLISLGPEEWDRGSTKVGSGLAHKYSTRRKQSDQKIEQNFAKVLDKVAQNDKISTSEVNLKVLNIYIKPHFKP